MENTQQYAQKYTHSDWWITGKEKCILFNTAKTVQWVKEFDFKDTDRKEIVTAIREKCAEGFPFHMVLDGYRFDFEPALENSLGFKKNVIDRAYEIAADNPSGFTVSSDMSEMPERGYAVALAATQGSFGLPGFLRALAFAVENDLHFGGWLNNEDGKYYFDAVKIFKQGQLQAADKFAQQQGQIALFNLDEGIEMQVPVNGDRIIIDSVFPEESEEPAEGYEDGYEDEDELVAYSRSIKAGLEENARTGRELHEAVDHYEFRFKEGDFAVLNGNQSGHSVELGTKVKIESVHGGEEPYYDITVVGDSTQEWITAQDVDLDAVDDEEEEGMMW